MRGEPLRAGTANRMRPVGFLSAGLVVVAMLWLRWSSIRTGIWGDLGVYVRGAMDLVARTPLYGPQASDLPFTYPPFAAIAFSPLLLLTVSSGRLLFTLGSLVSYLIIVALCGWRLRLSLRVVALIALAGMTLEPFVRTLLLGQVNLYLMAAVLVDCLVLRSSRRGWLVGIATGVKLVPGVFVLFFLLKRDWRAVFRALGGFLATVVLGLVVAPSDSLGYWRGGFLGISHFGPGAVVDGANQSLTGLFVRFVQDATPSKLWTAVLFAAGLALGIAAARRQLRIGGDVAALTSLAVGGLLASPLSWTHHWVWVLPAIMILVAARRWVMTWLFGLVFAIGFMWGLRLAPQQDSLAPLQQMACATYVVAGVVLLTFFAVGKIGVADRGDDSALVSASLWCVRRCSEVRTLRGPAQDP